MSDIRKTPKVMKKPKRVYKIVRKKEESAIATLLKKTYSEAIEEIKNLIERGSEFILVHANDVSEITVALKASLEDVGPVTVLDIIDIIASQQKRTKQTYTKIYLIKNIDKTPSEYIEELLIFLDKIREDGAIGILLAESKTRVDASILRLVDVVEIRNPGPEKIREWLIHILGEVPDEVVEAFLGLSVNQITFLIKKIIDSGLNPKDPENIRVFRRKYFGMRTIRRVTWEDLGGVSKIRELLYSRVVLPYRKFSLAKKLGYKLPKGILLVGPPGTGKTSIALALANDLNWNFFELGIGRILSSSSIVGEGEREIMDVFEKARKSAPAIILIDEIDGIGMIRGVDPNEAWRAPLLLTLLSEIEGVRDADGVLVIATTNRPDRLDPALVRRFDIVLEVPLPNRDARKEIFKIHLRDAVNNDLIEGNIDFDELAELTEGLSGAEIAHICEEVKAEAIRMEKKIDMDMLRRSIKTYLERKRKLTSILTEWDLVPGFLFT